MIKEFIDDKLEGISVVLFYIEADASSVIAESTLENISSDFENVNFYKSDISKDSTYAKRYSVYSVPKLVIFKDEEVIGSTIGLISHQVLRDLITSHIQ